MYLVGGQAVDGRMPGTLAGPWISSGCSNPAGPMTSLRGSSRGCRCAARHQQATNTVYLVRAVSDQMLLPDCAWLINAAARQQPPSHCVADSAVTA